MKKRKCAEENSHSDQFWKTLRFKEAVEQQREQHLFRMEILNKEKQAAEAQVELANLKLLLLRKENKLL